MNRAHADYSDMPYYSSKSAKTEQGLPETLEPLWGYLAKYFLPELEMCVETLNKLPEPEKGTRASIHPQQYVLGFGTFSHGNLDMQCAVRPMNFYMLQRVTDAYDALSAPDKTRIKAYFASSGLAPILELKAKYRIGRENHQEVWA